MFGYAFTQEVRGWIPPLNVILAAIFFLIILLVCSPAVTPVYADTDHCPPDAQIKVDETWLSSDSVHVITCDITVNADVTLTIEADAIIKFDVGYGLFILGELQIAGTATEPVNITSIRDDTIGGDTNGDGSSSSPARGDWLGIHFLGNSYDSSLIDHAVFRYGGGKSCADCFQFGTVTFTESSPTVQNTSVSESMYHALRADLKSFPTLNYNTLVDNAVNGLSLDGGFIENNSTWDITDTSYFIMDDVTVGLDKMLTIKPGVVIKPSTESGLFILGELQVEGTASEPVLFTSIRDDIIGDDTNGDGSISLPARGDWLGIQFLKFSSGSSLIDHAIFRYGGGKSCEDCFQFGTVTFTESSPAVQNTSVAESLYHALRADLKSFPTLSNNTLVDNSINALSLDTGFVEENSTWDITDTSYVTLGDITVGLGRSLSIKPGVKIKPNIESGLFILGELQVEGTVSEPVFFTSIRDDIIGGDSNGDGSISLPAGGDWLGIQFLDQSNDASVIDHAILRYGGGNTGCCDFEYGALTFMEASPTVQNTMIFDSQYFGIHTSFSSPNLVCNDIFANMGFGIKNNTPPVVVKAENHWWGDISGPTHPTNPDGLGDIVSDGVDFDPWATRSCVLAKANFTAEPANGLAPLTVRFTNLSTGHSSSLWDFGDGITTTVESPTHDYIKPGTYDVTLEVLGPFDKDVVSKVDYVTVYDPSVAKFSAVPTQGVAPLFVDFVNESSGDFTSCKWDFGDGNSSSFCDDPGHTYVAAGTYSVTLSLTGPGGKDSLTQVNFISAIPSSPTLSPINNPNKIGNYVLNWSIVAGTSEYELQERADDDSWNTIALLPDNKKIISPRSPGLWCYRVRSKAESGSGDWSNIQCTEVNYKIMLPLSLRR